MKRATLENEALIRLDKALDRVFNSYRGAILSPAVLMMMRKIFNKHMTPHESWTLRHTKELQDSTSRISKEEGEEVRRQLKKEGINLDVPKRRPQKGQRTVKLKK